MKVTICVIAVALSAGVGTLLEKQAADAHGKAAATEVTGSPVRHDTTNENRI